MKLFKKITAFLFAAVLALAVSVTAYAHDIPSFSESGKIISVAHSGDTMSYPKNSLAAIQSAFELGADCVSIDIKRTADGYFVLSQSDELGSISLEGSGMVISKLPLSQITSLHLTDKSGKLSEHLITDLQTVLQAAIAYDKTVIIDGEWESREQVYKFICDNNANNNAIIRTDAPKKEIASFITATSSMCRVIGEYHGNIIFSARSYITSLSKAGCSMIFLGTKNSFGVIFRNGVISAFSKTGYSARAAMKTYDMNESGTRPDCESTWSDIIDRGYSVIETDRIADLVSYLDKLNTERQELSALVSQAKSVESAFLTVQSRKDIETALKDAEHSLTTISSADTLSLQKSRLNLALNNKVFTDSSDKSSQGVFKVTAGKIAAIVIVLFVFIVVQIYFYYKQADKKLPRWIKKLLNK